MVSYYLDTSAAVKLYLAEVGSAWLRQVLLTSVSTIITSHLLRVEIGSAFERRLREGSVTLPDYSRMHDWFAEHRHSFYSFVPVSEPIIQQACQLIVHHPLRSYDALHLATALLINQQLTQAGAPPLIFLSADNRLNGVAHIEGLSVDNPNNHP
jgi:predicted nucleic acid-binding protein